MFLKYCVFSVVLLAFVPASFAQTTTTWVGDAGTWSDANNWSQNVPSNGDSAIVSSIFGQLEQDIPNLSLSTFELTDVFNLRLDQPLTVTDSLDWNNSTITGSAAFNIQGPTLITNSRVSATVNNFSSVEISQRLEAHGNSPEEIVWNNMPGSRLDLVRSPLLFRDQTNQFARFNNHEGAVIQRHEGFASYFIWDLYNDGLVQVDSNTQILFVNKFEQSETGILRLMASSTIVDLFGSISPAGLVEGNGQFIGTIEPLGIISPGLSGDSRIGSLRVFGNLHLTPKSTLQMDVGVTSDLINVNFEAVLDGRLELNFLPDVQLGTFNLISANNGLTSNGFDLAEIPAGVDAELDIDMPNGQVNVIVTAIPIRPNTINVVRGQLQTGDEFELQESDDADLSVTRSVTDLQPVIEVMVKGNTSLTEINSMDFVIESSVFARRDVTQTVELYDFDSESFVEVDSRVATRFTDQVVSIESLSNPGRFVEAQTGCVEARIRFASDFNRLQFAANVDQIYWKVN